MTARMIPYSEDTDKVAACREYLPLIDAAFAKPGGQTAQWVKSHLCAVCPLKVSCLDRAMLRGEAGIWGGTSPNMRSKNGAPPYRAATEKIKLGKRFRVRA